MIPSKCVYRSFSRSTTSIGSLRAEMVVKPTISLKYSVTSEKCSGFTGFPVFNAKATDLKDRMALYKQNKCENQSEHLRWDSLGQHLG